MDKKIAMKVTKMVAFHQIWQHWSFSGGKYVLYALECSLFLKAKKIYYLEILANRIFLLFT